jgi:hypothetical protein
MNPQAWIATLACGLLLGSGCSRAQSSTTPAAEHSPALAAGAQLEVKGCVTVNNGRFVLTDLDPATAASKTDTNAGAAPEKPVPTTETYRLVGMEDKLTGLAGERVDVAGTTGQDRVVDYRELSPEETPRNSGTKATTGTKGTTGSDGHISTSESEHIVVHDLHVESVEPLHERCGTR